jgi:hypothetical protein
VTFGVLRPPIPPLDSAGGPAVAGPGGVVQPLTPSPDLRSDPPLKGEGGRQPRSIPRDIRQQRVARLVVTDILRPAAHIHEARIAQHRR